MQVGFLIWGPQHKGSWGIQNSGHQQQQQRNDIGIASMHLDLTHIMHSICCIRADISTLWSSAGHWNLLLFVRRAGVQPGKSVAVLGAGPIGLVVLMCAQVDNTRTTHKNTLH